MNADAAIDLDRPEAVRVVRVVAARKRVADVARVGDVGAAALVGLALASGARPADWTFAPPLELAGATRASVGARVRLANLLVDVDVAGESRPALEADANFIHETKSVLAGLRARRQRLTAFWAETVAECAWRTIAGDSVEAELGRGSASGVREAAAVLHHAGRGRLAAEAVASVAGRTGTAREGADSIDALHQRRSRTAAIVAQTFVHIIATEAVS